MTPIGIVKEYLLGKMVKVAEEDGMVSDVVLGYGYEGRYLILTLDADTKVVVSLDDDIVICEY